MLAHQPNAWLPHVLVESVLIVVSIMVALVLDEWRETRQDDEVIHHALRRFLSEMQQNKSRVEDAAPFNRGLRNVLHQHYVDNDIKTIDEFVSMVESYNPVVLQSSAWDTAVATGSLAKMDYNVVSALSLTYSLQNRYQLVNRTGMSELTSPQNLAEGRLRLAVYNSVRYLDQVTTMETELGAVYSEANAVLQNAIDATNGKAPTSALSRGNDVRASNMPRSSVGQR
jgi:hypothetical protein